MAKKTSFADDAAEFADHVREFARETLERLADLADAHHGLHTSAEPTAGEAAAWSALAGPASAFGDVERAVSALASTGVVLSGEAAAAQTAGDGPAAESAKKTAANKPAAKKAAPAKKATAKKS